MSLIRTFCFFFIICFCFSCVEVTNKFTKLPPGIWRAYFKIYDKNEMDNASNLNKTVNYRELPFNFEVKYIDDDNFVIELINGEERILLDNIKYGIDRKTAKDTIVVDFPAYDSYLEGIFEEQYIEGNWIINYKEGYSIPFVAEFGQAHRFAKNIDESPSNFDGNWFTNFDYDTEDPWTAIGEFEQNESKIKGTFITETGDFRYLDGDIIKDKMYLSCFDGAHAFLFEGKMTGDNEITGKFFSGNHYESNWTAEKSEVSLTDPLNLTKATQTEAIDFKFPNQNGEMISLSELGSNPKIINIMGTWCPNCRDEANFLLNNYELLSNQNIDIISICFERYRDQEKSMNAIKRYKEKMEIPWPILLGGYANKSEATEALPFIDKVISYPTMIFLNDKNEVVKIHTGFNGPATSKFEDFKIEFNQIVSELTNQHG